MKIPINTIVYLSYLLYPAFAFGVAADTFECHSEIALPQAEKTLSVVDAEYSKVSDLVADFIQYSTVAVFEDAQQENGKGMVYFKKPGMMDWQYSEPNEDRFVSNGVTFWFYQPKERQVTLTDFRETFQSDLPVSFLLGAGKLHENFSVKKACKTDRGALFDLEPRVQDKGLKQFQLAVSRGDNVPIGAKVTDVAGNETQIALVNVRLNTALKADRFQFDVPPNVFPDDRRTQLSVGANRPLHEDSLVVTGPQDGNEPKEVKEKDGIAKAADNIN